MKINKKLYKKSNTKNWLSQEKGETNPDYGMDKRYLVNILFLKNVSVQLIYSLRFVSFMKIQNKLFKCMYEQRALKYY